MTGTVWDSVGQIPDDRSLREAIRQRVEAAGTSFYWAMRLLPSDRRHGMYAIYAFCREVDDIADDFAPPPQKQAALADWHPRLEYVDEAPMNDSPVLMAKAPANVRRIYRLLNLLPGLKRSSRIVRFRF